MKINWKDLRWGSLKHIKVKGFWRKIFTKRRIKSLLVMVVCITIPDLIITYLMSEEFKWWFNPHTVMFMGGAVWGAYERHTMLKPSIKWQYKR